MQKHETVTRIGLVYKFKKGIYKKTSFTFDTIEFTCIRCILIDSRSETDIDCRQSKQTETDGAGISNIFSESLFFLLYYIIMFKLNIIEDHLL